MAICHLGFIFIETGIWASKVKDVASWPRTELSNPQARILHIEMEFLVLCTFNELKFIETHGTNGYYIKQPSSVNTQIKQYKEQLRNKPGQARA